ncbi:MAG: alkane 1-monooxygenase, partial [Bacteroidota bacterium]
MHHRIKALKYLTPFIFFIGASISFQTTGWMVWINMIIAWILVPVLELVFKPNPTNLETAEEELVKKDSFYDWILHLVVPLQY